MRKKALLIIAVMLVTVILATVLAGCSTMKDMSDSEYLGTWVATTCEYAEYVMDASEIVGEYSVTLNSDGTYSAAMEDVTGDGTWAEVEGGFQLDGDSDLTFLEDEGCMALEYNDIVVYFESR